MMSWRPFPESGVEAETPGARRPDEEVEDRRVVVEARLARERRRDRLEADDPRGRRHRDGPGRLAPGALAHGERRDGEVTDLRARDAELELDAARRRGAPV